LTDAQRALAAVELRRGNIDALLQTADQIISAQPYSPDGFLLRGMAEINRQKYSDAEQDARKAMDRAPQDPRPYIQMGNIHLAQKHFDQAWGSTSKRSTGTRIDRGSERCDELLLRSQTAGESHRRR